MASLRGKTSNPELDSQATDQLFRTLEEWNDHLERYALGYSDTEIGSETSIQPDSTIG